MDRKIITEDGTVTFHSEKHDETYHSTSGALTEADKKYAEVCRIGERKHVTVLDVCFGLGYNTAAAIDRFCGKKITVTGLEIYQGIIDEIARMGDEYPFKCRHMIKEAAEKGRYSDERVKIELLMGDARQTVKNLEPDSFDCVFFDPFSPKKCPWMWTEEFFKDIYKVMTKGGVLATYSCARSVRENLKKTGFVVEDGPCVGRRAPGTKATKA
ncbi:methyltransferase domain-containing protein [Candidatus Woesearchaeota archaeon]|nr:methyltransferase domain-containing protein [Candidatus Woesearchaeota archaeon]